MSDEIQQESNPSPAVRRKRLLAAAKAVILVVTVGALGYHAIRAGRELQDQEVHFRWGWLLLSIVTYYGGLSLLSITWWLVLRDAGESTSLMATARTYLVSHMGKYVPGKAMVIVIRYAMLRPYEVSLSRITVTTAFETFATMGSGALLAFLCITFATLPDGFSELIAKYPWINAGVFLLALGFLGATIPRSFRILSTILLRPFAAQIREQAIQDIRGQTTVAAILIGLLSWTIIGISFLCCINTVVDVPLRIDALPATTSCVSISIVVGFLSMIPGQAGVRDLVLDSGIVSLVGELHALAASLLFRLITLLAEGVFGGILYLGGRR